MASPGVTKPRCTYWDKCYRKNADHKDNFRHPGDDDSSVDKDEKHDTAVEKKNKNKVIGARVDLRTKRVIFSVTFATHTRPQMIARAKMFGCVVQTTMRKDTDAVVCGENPGKASEDAKDKATTRPDTIQKTVLNVLCIKVYTEEEWNGVLLQAKPVRGYKASRRNKDATVCSDSDDEDYEPGTRKRKMPAGRKRKSSDD